MEDRSPTPAAPPKPHDSEFIALPDIEDPLLARGRRMRFLHRFIVLAVGALALFGILNALFMDRLNGIVEGSAAAVGLLILLFLRTTGRVDAATNLVLVEMLFVFTYLAMRGGMGNSGIYWWYTLPAGVFYLKGVRKGWFWIGSILTIFILIVLLKVLHLMESTYPLSALLVFFVSYLVVSFIGHTYEANRRNHEQVLEGTNLRLSREIAERARAEEALVRAKHEAEAANLTKSEFLSRISHELRTPMNAILGFAHLMDSDAQDPLSPAHRENLHQVLQAGNHLLGLINEVLDLSRIETGQLRLAVVPVHLGPLMEEILPAILTMAGQRGITLEDRSGAWDDVWVSADPARLKQILFNLLSNAVHYNREGGIIRLEGGPTMNGRLLFSVTDTGRGLTPEQQAKIFEPFSSISSKAGPEGAGIGLPLSVKLLSLMNGALALQSTPGLGSRFTLDLLLAPLAERKAAVESAPPPQAKRSDGTARTVLYIEDNPSNQILMEHILRRRPHIRLLMTSQGLPGLELARTHHPDLILLDIRLPDISGVEVFLRLKALEETKAIPVVAVSASAMPQEIAAVKEAGITDYLTKPLNVPLFLETVDKLLAARGA